MFKISPHAKTLIALLDNSRTLCCVHHEYAASRDVIKSLQKISKSLGFDIDKEVFEYILSSIGSKQPDSMQKLFDGFQRSIIRLDIKLGKEHWAGDKKDVRKK